jgi:arsenate reductase
MNERLVFLCPHGAAKSVMAAAYCQQLADQWGVALHITSAGTEPDAEVAPAVVALLRADGIDIAGYRPWLVTVEEFMTAHRIIALGCDLGDLERPGMAIERWDDVPPASQNLPGARERIRAHVEQLVVAITHAELRAPDSA